jgi:hypothetical protein
VTIKTIKSLTRSKKNLSNNSFSGKSFRSMRGLPSNRSLKSCRSLAPNVPSQDAKKARKLKTEGCITYLKAPMKKISCIRNYRDKLFRQLGEMFSNNKLSSKDVFDVTTLNFFQGLGLPEAEANRLASINDLLSESDSEQTT